MIRFILFIWNYLIEYSSANIIDLITLTLICYGGWKLFTNHLNHIHQDIKEIKTSQQELEKTVTEKFTKVSNILSRLSKSVLVRDTLCSERHTAKAKKKSGKRKS